MNPGARVAVGVGIGYFLGRTKKMRLALMLAGAGLTGKLPSSPQELLQRGTSMLSSSPEIHKITESVRGELMSAARAAAVTAASTRIDALNERLQDRTARPSADEEPEGDDDREYSEDHDDDREHDQENDDVEEADSAEEDPDEYIEDDTTEDEEPEPERPAPRKRSTRPRATRKTAASQSSESDDTESPPRRPRARAARSESTTSGRAPVRRTRR
ncbi:hypothetical protein [Rhodococcus sp. SJ-3]|uniref:hypothetical protein n=1 Tax=Rhodococcus sp. SJ-3 TaxID=3454628 RepID=UPI003F7AEEEE